MLSDWTLNFEDKSVIWHHLRYVYPFYKEGADPKKVLGANERMYSQCKRIQIAAWLQLQRDAVCWRGEVEKLVQVPFVSANSLYILQLTFPCPKTLL